MKKIMNSIIALVGVAFCLLFVLLFLSGAGLIPPMAGLGYALIAVFIYGSPFFAIVAIVLIIMSLSKKAQNPANEPQRQETLHRLTSKEIIIIAIAILVIAYCVYRYVPWAN